MCDSFWVQRLLLNGCVQLCTRPVTDWHCGKATVEDWQLYSVFPLSFQEEQDVSSHPGHSKCGYIAKCHLLYSWSLVSIKIRCRTTFLRFILIKFFLVLVKFIFSALILFRRISHMSCRFISAHTWALFIVSDSGTRDGCLFFFFFIHISPNVLQC